MGPGAPTPPETEEVDLNAVVSEPWRDHFERDGLVARVALIPGCEAVAHRACMEVAGGEFESRHHVSRIHAVFAPAASLAVERHAGIGRLRRQPRDAAAST